MGAVALKYVWNEKFQKGYILSVFRAGLGVSGVIYEILDLIPRPKISIAYPQVSAFSTFVFFRLYCVFS